MSSCRTPRPLALWSSAVALGLLLANGTASPAALMQYEYSGVITSADPSTGVAVGTPFSGTFAYDPALAPSSSSPAVAGTNQYAYGTAGPSGVPDGSGLTLQVGGQTVLPDPGGVVVTIAGAQYPGQWGWPNTTPFLSVGISNGQGANDSSSALNNAPVGVVLSFTNPAQAVFSSLAPPPYLSLADFPQAQLNVVDLTTPGDNTLYTGTIDALTEVPEPTFASLFCVAAAGWLAHSRYRRVRRGDGY